MDSLSQIALGAAVSVAVFRQRQPIWKSALLGAIAGTLPDLDVLVQFDDPISEMTRHRAESHGLFYLTLACWPLAWLWRQLAGQHGSFQRCWWACWAVLISHPLLDFLTIYGTQLAQPFSDYAFGTGSVFVIDPLYTLPLLLGLGLVLRGRTLRCNDAMLALSTAYLAFGLLAQQWVYQQAARQLPPDADATKVLVTATPFNTQVWQVLALGPSYYYEAFYALADGDKALQWRAWPRDSNLLASYQQEPLVRQLTRFSHDYVVLTANGSQLILSDLRMGLAPHYSFRFVFEQRPDGSLSVPTRLAGSRGSEQLGAALQWLWRRATAQPAPAFFNPQLDPATALQPVATTDR